MDAAGFRGEIIPTGFAGARHAAEEAQPYRRQGRLLHPLDGDLHHRRHLGSGLFVGRRRTDRAEARRPGAHIRIRAVPSARPSCPSRHVWRLLLPQQCGDRRPGLSRFRRQSASPSSMSISIMAMARRISSMPATMCSSARCMASPKTPSPISSATRTRRAPARAKASTSTIRCRPAPNTMSGARRSRMPCRKIKRYKPDALVVSLGVDTFKDDPISFFKLTSDDFTTYGGAHREAQAADPVRDGRRLCRRGDRHQHGKCAGRILERIGQLVS